MTPLAIAPEVAARTSEVTHFTEHAVWTGIHQREYGSWLRARRHVLTASAMPILLGVSPWKDPLDLYVEKTRPDNDVEAMPDEREAGALDDPRTWGRELEQAIAQTVCKAHQWELFEGGALLVSQAHPMIGATLDDELLGPDADGRWVVYEGKTVTVFKTRDWDVEAQMPPDHVWLQAQGQLLVTGAPIAVVFALVGGNTPKQIIVEPNAELHALMVEAVDEFVERCRTLDPPPPTARSEKAIKALYPEESGATIELEPEVLEWTNEWVELGKQRLELEKREKELKNLIRMKVGDASFGALPGPVSGYPKPKMWKCETQSRDEHVVAASSSRVLRLVNDNSKKTTAQMLADSSVGRGSRGRRKRRGRI